MYLPPAGQKGTKKITSRCFPRRKYKSVGLRRHQTAAAGSPSARGKGDGQKRGGNLNVQWQGAQISRAASGLQTSRHFKKIDTRGRSSNKNGSRQRTKMWQDGGRQTDYEQRNNTRCPQTRKAARNNPNTQESGMEGANIEHTQTAPGNQTGRAKKAPKTKTPRPLAKNTGRSHVKKGQGGKNCVPRKKKIG